MKLRRLAATAAATALLTSGLTGPAQAAPTWMLPATTISAPDSVDADVAVAPSGEATAVWLTYDGDSYVVMAASRPSGGTWSAPVPVSDAAPSGNRPTVVVDGAGTATALWMEFAGMATLIRASRRPAGGTWSAPEQVSDRAASHVEAGIDAAGRITAAWLRIDDDFKRRLRVRTWTASEGWSSPVDLSPAGQNADDPNVAVAPGGRAYAAWSWFNGSSSDVQSSALPPGGFWELPITLNVAANGSGAPDIAASDAGAVATWAQLTGPDYLAWASVRPAGGLWSPAERLSPLGATTLDRIAAVDGAGNATVAWAVDVAGSYQVQAATRAAGGSWTGGLEVSSPGGSASNLAFAVDPSGTTTLAWNRYNGSRQVAQASRRPVDGSWTAPLDLSAPTTNAYGPELAPDAAGDLAAIWQTDVGAASTIQATGLDVAGPVVSAFAAPATGTAGMAMAFSAGAVDTWSSVASYAWSFGDGGTATGASASHTYANPGSYSVSLTVTDAVGNATTRTATTAVTAMAAPVPAIATFRLKHKTIATDEKTKLKVRLNTASTLKLVFKSKHQHVIKGKKKYVKVVLKEKLPAGLSKITIKAKIKGKILVPDTYVITGTAKNTSGKSPKKKVKLKVVR